jgi:hypothetical protein
MPYWSLISPAFFLPLPGPCRAYRVEELSRAPLVDREVTALLESGLSEGSALLLEVQGSAVVRGRVSVGGC